MLGYREIEFVEFSLGITNLCCVEKISKIGFLKFHTIHFSINRLLKAFYLNVLDNNQYHFILENQLKAFIVVDILALSATKHL